MPDLRTVPGLQSERLLHVLADYSVVRIVTHDNPDPDAMAAGWGLYTLFQERLDCPVELVGGGAIVRAENRHMVDLLNPPLHIVDKLDDDANAATVLVDCTQGTSNHLATRGHLQPTAIIDHHFGGPSPEGVPFTDIRPFVAATATIVASYLREQGIEPGVKLASAMLYAIRTETCGCETEHSPLDRTMVLWLTGRAEPGLIAEIENAPLARSYFSDLVLALQGTLLYRDTALCLLPRASGMETVGEVADLLIRCQGICRVLCGGVIDEDLYVSVRTRQDDGSAVELLQKTLEGIGGGGGHEHRAGGKVVGIASGGRMTESLEQQLRDRWLAACGEGRHRPKRLIGLREIVENL
ncbi:MAG TPA: DHH family phosphoesterase [Planctomycetaceae bacterium]|jgi:nanoRNase/pAp phosphatase (c-di-AMP/oligoRNAs hydrolase)|nr:DHH family phosphoesterase [Planctomycetaceae bacterium]